MAIDYNLLRTLSPEDGMAYLRQALAGGMGEYVPGGEGSGFGEGAVPGEPGYYSALGRGVNVIQGWEGYGQQSEYDGVAPGTRRTNQAIIEGPGGRSYVATFDQDGKLTDVGRQMADSWYDKEIAGVPIGAFLPVAAAAAAAYAPGLLADGGFINGVSGEAVMVGSEGAAGGMGNGLYSLAPEGTSVTLGGSTTTVGGAGIGGGAAGSGLVPGGALGTGIGGGAMGTGLTVGGLTAAEIAGGGSGVWNAIKSGVGTVADMVGGGKNLAGLVGAAIGAATSRDGETTKTEKREPWEPAQQWMKDNITEGQRLQQQYKDNPFNDVQLAGYRNLLSGIDNFNTNTAPGLMNWANGWMGGSRDFDPAAAIRSSPFAGGLLSQQPGNASGRPVAAPGGPFSAPQHSPYQGLLQDTLRWPAQQPPPPGAGSGEAVGPGWLAGERAISGGLAQPPAARNDGGISDQEFQSRIGGYDAATRNALIAERQRDLARPAPAPYTPRNPGEIVAFGGMGQPASSSVNTTYSGDIMGRGAPQPTVFSPRGGSVSMVMPGSGGGPAGGLDYLRALGMGRR